jgi:hypothetical protein
MGGPASVAQGPLAGGPGCEFERVTVGHTGRTPERLLQARPVTRCVGDGRSKWHFLSQSAGVPRGGRRGEIDRVSSRVSADQGKRRN